MRTKKHTLSPIGGMSMPTKRVKHIGLRVVPEVHDKMAYIAQYEGRTLNGQVYYLMQTCIRTFEKEHGPISEEDVRKALQD